MNPPSAASAAGTPAASAWQPFRSRVFLVMWTALLLGNMGTWMRDVGAGWLMTTLAASATAVALVQVATTLPIFLLSLPAGALADIIDRRRGLILIHVAMTVVVLVMAVVAQQGALTAPGLVLGLLLAGMGTALAQPMLQSLTPMMVPRSELRSAVALNSMGVNVSRAIGPALGGLIVAGWGVAANFYLDALSYLAVIAALVWWRGASQRASSDPPERLLDAMGAGLRYAVYAPGLRRVMLRASSFFAFASAYWALLPLIARQQLGGGPGYYGLLVACIGAGAVGAAVALPALRRRLGAEATFRLGIGLTVLVLVALASTRTQWVGAVAMAVAGMAWIAALTTVNVAAQTQLPNWVRGRGLALYLTVFYGAMTAGSLAWGALADAASIAVSLWTAAALGGLALLLGLARPLPDGEPDLAPSMHWPQPQLSDKVEPDRGPVLVTIEYRVEPASVAPFLQALRAFSNRRRRDGAYGWGVYEDAAAPGVFLETFLVASWQDHERQHHRVSREDEAAQKDLHRFHSGTEAPRVRHLLAPATAPGETS